MSNTQMKIAASAAIIGGMIASAVSASAALNLPTQNCNYMFNTNMKLGSRGTDVMNLQKVLNAYPQTRVAASGAGSPGMETTYFGAATRAAVNKFHALHLVELGITAPTGNVFAGTRALLNAICTTGNTGNTGNNGNNGGTTTTGPVSVMMSSSQPTGLLVAGQASGVLANLVFSGNGTVTNLELQRTGVSTDSALTNVYLYDGNTRLTDAASVVTGGYIRFANSYGLFAVNGTRNITVRSDIAASTTGQTVGVKLNSVTTMGGSATAFSNVMGNNLTIGSVTPATVNFSNVIDTALTVDAGTTNYNVFRSSLNVGTRDVWLRAVTFRYVGSAPVDAFANLSLYVDGTKVAGPMMINAANNNRLTFDLGSNPFVLRTGQHTVDVRGDVVKGSNRTATFSIENSADFMVEDSNLAGVFITPTVNNGVLNSSTADYGTITVNKGSVTVDVDPSFTASEVTGGATNMTLGQFVIKAYGEDVKVNTLNVSINSSTTSPAFAGLSNVGLYVNGGQVSSSQNLVATGTPLTFNLGSSLIVPAGQSVTVAVKADLRTTGGVNYTSGNFTASIGGVAGNAQGQSSSEIVSVAATSIADSQLTISSGVGSFARTSGFTASTVSPNTQNVKIGSWSVQAGSAEATIVNSATVTLSPSDVNTLQNYTNLTLKTSDGTILSNPQGTAQSTNTFSFGDVTVAQNSTKIFDLYANIGASTTASVTPSLQISYRGAVSNNTQTSSVVAGVAVSSQTAVLAAATLVSNSPVAQYVVGGTTQEIGKFKLSTSQSDATVRKINFNITGTDAITSLTVNGVNANVVNGTAVVSGLSIPITTSGTDVSVVATYSGFKNSTTGGNLITGVTPVSITLDSYEATSGNGQTLVNGTDMASANMSLVASKPTVTVSAGNTNAMQLSAESKVGEFTVTADVNGKISVASTTMIVTANNVTSPTFGSFRVADGNTTITGSSATSTTNGSSATVLISFAPNYEISAGQSKTFSVYGVVGGSQAASGVPHVVSSLTPAGFQWRDVVGGNVQYSGATILNFPTTSYSTTH